MQRTKILVTGDREWDDVSCVVEALSVYPQNTILVHGACRGADIICAAVGEQLGFEIRSYPADWSKHKRAAGPIRNQHMLNAEHVEHEQINVCLAFHNRLAESKGTIDMITRAKKAGIKVTINTSRVAPMSDACTT